MSCDWDIGCFDCKDQMGISDANHKDDLMRKLIAAREGFEKIAESGLEDHELEIKAGYSHGFSLQFFVDHKGHDLRPIDEYGQWDGQCGESIRCPSCDDSHHCVLDKDHVGDHRFKQPKA